VRHHSDNPYKYSDVDIKGILGLIINCGSLVVMFSLGIQEVVRSSPARVGRVKPNTFKIVSDCSIAKSMRITGLSDMTLKTVVPCCGRCGTKKNPRC
jgi:hypothetical protein